MSDSTANAVANKSPDDKVIVNEALKEVSGSKAAASKLFWIFLMTVATGVGNALTAIAPELTHALLSFLPPWIAASAGSIITALIMAVAAYLSRLGTKQHREAVTEALVTDAPASLKVLYEKKDSE